ncbi:Transposon Tf2-9 polyprotein [Labeo rohita]|uniref:Gypsy retrotransposon integrase-like protein 1 n=1 Tax=Labeo rohita TaxID=84645 RepID=A0ABQ8L9N1_LABRO|nr:Transposon Tf2-9 polyprotein [Labeo rohita]
MFITPFGRYCFRRLPFGISSAPEHFQLRILQIIAGTTGVLCHADDILVFGKDKKEHDVRLGEVLKKFEKAGLTLNDKCVFAVKRVKFLGRTISAQGIEADQDKIQAILNMPEPQNVEGVRRFMGMVNYVGKFSPHLPTLTKPLRDLLRNDSIWVWDAQQKEAFAKVKEELSSPAILVQYCPSSETVVSADASSYGLGGVLMQKLKNGEWRPVVYISRSLTATETRYAQIEKEALAENNSSLQMRCHEHHPDLKKSTDIETLEDECRVFVDLIVQQIPATSAKLKQIQEMQNCQQLKQYTQKGWPEHRKTVTEHLMPYWSHRADIHVANGILLKGERILIPKPMQREMLDRLHQGHQGTTKCIARAQQSMWWPGIIRDIRELVERCDICCLHSQQKTEQLMPTPLPARPWQQVAADIFQWEGGHYLVVVDYFSRYIEVANLPKLVTATTVERLKVIFARFGIPETLLTDNGPQFASCEFAEFARDYDFEHVTSSPRYSQSNGEAE